MARVFLFSLGLCLLVSLAAVQCKPEGSSEKSSGSKHPNIIVIMDEMRWEDVSWTNPDVITPVMAELASTGVILDKHYISGCSTTARSHLLTGNHSTTQGLQTDLIRPSAPYGLRLDQVTMADRLKKQGYATHFVGKWNLGNFQKEYTPTYRGFDTFYGFYSALVQHFDHRLPCPANLSDWGYDMWDSAGEEIQRVRPQDMVGTYDTFLFGDRAVRNIDRHDKSKPLFMFVAARDNMGPLGDVPQVYTDLYNDKMDSIELGLRQRYGRSTIVDDLFRKVVEALKFNDMWEDTVLVFLSDKPGHSHPLFSVPTIGGMYSYVKGVDINNYPDLFPTLLHLAGVEGVEDEPNMYGKNAWDLISEGGPNPRTELLHLMGHGYVLQGEKLYEDTFDTRIWACLYAGDLKINTGYFPEWSKTYYMYNMTSDPTEQTDLSDLPAYNTHLRAMLAKLQVYHLASAPPLFFAAGNEPDPASCPRHHNGYFDSWR